MKIVSIGTLFPPGRALPVARLSPEEVEALDVLGFTLEPKAKCGDDLRAYYRSMVAVLWGEDRDGFPDVLESCGSVSVPTGLTGEFWKLQRPTPMKGVRLSLFAVKELVLAHELEVEAGLLCKERMEPPCSA